MTHASCHVVLDHPIILGELLNISPYYGVLSSIQLLPFKPKYLLQRIILEHPQPVLFFSCYEHSFSVT